MLISGKSTLWTNTAQDRNFQRTSSAIGPYQFRGKFVWTDHWSIPFSGEICMDQWSWKFFKSFPLHWHWSMDGSFQNFTGGAAKIVPHLGARKNNQARLARCHQDLESDSGGWPQRNEKVTQKQLKNISNPESPGDERAVSLDGRNRAIQIENR